MKIFKSESFMRRNEKNPLQRRGFRETIVYRKQGQVRARRTYNLCL